MDPAIDNDNDNFDLDIPPSAEFIGEGEPTEEESPAPEPQAEPTPEPEPEPASPDEQGADEPENWEDRYEAELKRRKDSQRSYNEEHQARLRLERELEEMRALNTRSATPEEPEPEFDEEAFYDDPAAAIKKIRAQQKQQFAEIQQQQQQQRLQWLEDVERRKHSDYDDLVTNFLVPEMQKDRVLVTEWQKNGGTPDAAYSMAKRLRAIRDNSGSPESHEEMEARIRKEIEAEYSGRAPRPGRTLSGQASAKPPPRLKSGAVNLPEDDTELLMQALRE